MGVMEEDIIDLTGDAEDPSASEAVVREWKEKMSEKRKPTKKRKQKIKSVTVEEAIEIERKKIKRNYEEEDVKGDGAPVADRVQGYLYDVIDLSDLPMPSSMRRAVESTREKLNQTYTNLDPVMGESHGTYSCENVPENDNTPSCSGHNRKETKQKGKKAKDSKKKKEPEEKRARRFRSKCPSSVQERMSRALGQKMYLVARNKDHDLMEKFSILGSTGNVYTVCIDKIPNCDCPDFGKGHTCKHILFVFLKVLKQAQTSSYIYQLALLEKELVEIFTSAPPDPTSAWACAEARRAFNKHNSIESSDIPEDAPEGNNRKPIEGDCPICYEEMDPSQTVVYCKRGCGNNVHLDCFNRWKKSLRGKTATCCMCRTEWEEAPAKKGKKKSGSTNEGTYDSNGYLNLADVAGISRRRDTSTYHTFGRFGRGWGRGRSGLGRSNSYYGDFDFDEF
eukprot:Nk52_evm3s284 gene=Nk52_evmTU3s284